MCLVRARSNGKENGLLSRPSAFPIPVTLNSPSSMHCVCVLWTHGLLSRTGELVTCVSWNLPALQTHGLSCWGPLRVTVWLYPKHTWPPQPLHFLHSGTPTIRMRACIEMIPGLVTAI